MSDDDLVTFGCIQNDINYDPYADRKSKRQEYIQNKISSRLKNIINLPITAIANWESDEFESLESDLEGNGTKTFVVLEDSDEIWARLQVPL